MATHGNGFRILGAADANWRLGRAWLALCLAIGVHVADEAATGFLAVYNPTAEAIRAKLPWLPLPVFSFETWIAGLIMEIIVLLALSAFVIRGARWMRPVAYALALIMVPNALVHTLGTVLGRTVESVQFPRPMPGFYSSPLLLAASIYLLLQLRFSGSTGVEPRLQSP